MARPDFELCPQSLFIEWHTCVTERYNDIVEGRFFTDLQTEEEVILYCKLRYNNIKTEIFKQLDWFINASNDELLEISVKEASQFREFCHLIRLKFNTYDFIDSIPDDTLHELQRVYDYYTFEGFEKTNVNLFVRV